MQQGNIIKPKIYQTRQFKESVTKIIVTIILLAGAWVAIMPLLWMFFTSVKSMEEIMSYPPTFFPKKFIWRNYIDAWNSAPFTRYTLNTLFLTTIGVISHVIVNSFIAYGFAKIGFRMKSKLFTLVLSTMMIPGFVTLIPTYILFAKLGWVGTYLPLIVPGFFGSAYEIFLLRQFFMSLPDEYVEAAKIDGANHFYIWAKLMVPLIKPALLTVGIMTFNGAWNDFLGPLLYVNNEMMYTLQIGLQNFRGTVQTQWHYLMAASVLVLLPVIIIFFVFQKYFIEGMNIQVGVKG
ncbi:carbohydrate ABC transporter permease [Caldicellulosiruptoraceae bacterium PP1]